MLYTLRGAEIGFKFYLHSNHPRLSGPMWLFCRLVNEGMIQAQDSCPTLPSPCSLLLYPWGVSGHNLT